ncbi:MAG: hypothetical protein JWQ69_3796 [Pseudomonas sp.]|nr:hypothetical protein [Pseudomonas sp.]
MFKIFPTLRVGMQPSTLRVHPKGFSAAQSCDAERHGWRYHAERGNDQNRGSDAERPHQPLQGRRLMLQITTGL